MKYLLDTHALLWCADGNDLLPASAIEVIDDVHNDIAVSVASLWEIAIRLLIRMIFREYGSDCEKTEKHHAVIAVLGYMFKQRKAVVPLRQRNSHAIVDY